MNQIFIQEIHENDWGNKRYFSKKSRKRGPGISRQYFVPDDYKKNKMEIDAAVHRGRAFLTGSDGFLFGAKIDLTKFGKFIIIPG